MAAARNVAVLVNGNARGVTDGVVLVVGSAAGPGASRWAFRRGATGAG